MSGLEHERLRTLWDVITYHADRAPRSIALEFEGRRTTYADLVRDAKHMRRSLSEEGVGAGDRVVYLGKNSDRYFILLFAAAASGVVLVPLNWRLAPNEWVDIVQDAGAALVFAEDDFLQRAQALARDANLREPLSLTAEAAAKDSAAAGEDGPALAPDDIVLQIYTSGTTGRSKGVMLSHRNVLALREPGFRAGLQWFPGPEDASLVVMPVAHIAGTAYALFGLYSGGRVVLAREFDPGATLDLLQSAEVTHLLLAPAAIRQVLEHPKARQVALPKLKFMTYGASPIPEALLRQCMVTFACRFVQMYGLTEAAGGAVALTPEDHESGDPLLLRSAGRAMPGVELAVLDRDGRALPAGEPGEIALRSEAVTAGYWGRPEATREAITSDGWLRTGDMGHMDGAGYIFILDRVKDMIVSGGENVYPAEVENAIFGHPDIADVAVIGVPSEEWGEEVMAIVVPRPGCMPDPDSIRQWLRQKLAGFKIPKSFQFVEHLPRNAGGKLLRRELREPYWRNMDRSVH